MKEKIDIILNKWVSRKLMVFCIASFALFSAKLSSSDWVIISTAYISLEGVTTIVDKLMKNKS